MPVVKGDTVPLHRHAVSGRNGVCPTDEGDPGQKCSDIAAARSPPCLASSRSSHHGQRLSRRGMSLHLWLSRHSVEGARAQISIRG